MSSIRLGTVLLLTLLAACAPLLAGERQDPLLRLAIEPFESISADSGFDALKRSLPELLALALMKSNRVQYVSRRELEAASERGETAGGGLDSEAAFSVAALDRASIDLLLRGEIFAYRGKVSLRGSLSDLRTGSLSTISSDVVEIEDVFEGVNQFVQALAAEIATADRGGRSNRLAVLCFTDTSAVPSVDFAWLGQEIPVSLVSYLSLENVEVLPWSDTRGACSEEWAGSAEALERLGVDGVLAGSYSVADGEILTVVPSLLTPENPEPIQLAQAQAEMASYLDTESQLAADVRDVLEAIAAGRGDWRLGPLLFSSAEPQDFLAKGKEYLARGDDVYLAVLMFLRAVELAPEDPEGHYLLGVARTRQERYGEATAALQRALTIDDDHVPAHEALGNAYLEQGHYNLAVTAFEAALALDSDRVDVRIGLAGAYRLSGDPKAAIREYNVVLEKDPSDVATLNSLAQSYRAAKMEAEAEDTLLSAFVVAPDDQVTRFGLADLYASQGGRLIQQGEYGKALIEFEKAAPLRKDPNDWRAIIFLNLKLGNLERAESEFQSATGAVEADASLYNNGGFALFAVDRLEESLDAFEEAIRLDPALGPAWNGKGNAERSLGRYKAAIRSYREAARLNPTSATPLVGLGVAAASAGDAELALDSFGKALEIDPDDPAIYNNKAFSLGQLGRHEEAIEVADEALERSPDFANVYNHKGYSLYRLGRIKEGLGLIARAVELNPEYAGSYFNLARIAMDRDDTLGALDNLEKAIQLGSSYRWLAQIDDAFTPIREETRFQELVSRTPAT